MELLDEYCSLFLFLPVFGGGDREPARALDLRHAGRVLESRGPDVVAAAANRESGCLSERGPWWSDRAPEAVVVQRVAGFVGDFSVAGFVPVRAPVSSARAALSALRARRVWL